MNKQYFNKKSILYVDGDSFEQQIFAKSAEKHDLTNIDSIYCVGSDHRFTKYTARYYKDDLYVPIQIYIDRAKDYKPIMFYGHEGWLC